MSATLAEERIKFISPEPKLAQLLRKRGPIISENLHKFIVDYIEDVGTILRDRGFITYTAASFASYGVLLVIAELFPTIRRLGIVSKAMGIAER